jgi:hypothetical protein
MQPELTGEERARRAVTFIPEANKRLAELEKRITSTTPPDQVKAIQTEQKKISDAIQEARQFLPKVGGIPYLPPSTSAAAIDNPLDYPSVPKPVAAAATKKPNVAAAKTGIAAAAAAAAPNVTERDSELGSLIPANQQARPAPSRDFGSYVNDFSGQTKGYIDEMTKAMEALTPTAEEKERQGSERKGVMALKAAQALLKPGTTGEGARGGALGEIADLTAAYAKEDSADKKAMIGAKINMLGAQAQLAQGNAKAAADSFQHAERLAAEGVKLDSERWFQGKKIELEKQKLLNDDTYHKLLIDSRNREISMMSEWRQAQIEALGAKGEITPALVFKARGEVDKEVDAAWDKLGNIGQLNATKDPYWKAKEFNKRLITKIGLDAATPYLQPVPEGRQVNALPSGAAAGKVTLP